MTASFCAVAECKTACRLGPVSLPHYQQNDGHDDKTVNGDFAE